MKTFSWLATSLLLIHATATLAESKPEDFALRFNVQLAPGASLQRLAMPKAALAALQTPNAADVRLFNANGQAVPIALIPPRVQSVTSASAMWPTYPIMATPQQQNLGNVSLRIEKSAGLSVVRVIESAEAKPGATAAKQIAALVDTRKLNVHLSELTVDAELAPGQPVALTLTASKDLKNWRTLAQDVPVFRFGSNANAPGSMRIPLSGVQLDNEYLRISWPTGAAFKLTSVRITPAAATAPPQRLAIPLTAVSDGDATLVSLPFATPLQALDIRPADPNTLVPIHLSGRNMRGEAWRPLTSNVVYRIHSNGVETIGPPIELNGISVREIRIVPAAGTVVLNPPPQVNALLSPMEWAFVASGPAPFTLAVGRSGTQVNRLTLASLIPGYAVGDENKLHVALVDEASVTTTPPDTLTRISQTIGAPSPRTLILWAVLIGGVLILGGIAWAVIRQMKGTDTPSA